MGGHPECYNLTVIINHLNKMLFEWLYFNMWFSLVTEPHLVTVTYCYYLLNIKYTCNSFRNEDNKSRPSFLLSLWYWRVNMA